jgi:hypothetical protein
MARYIELRVEVVETDEDGKAISRLCSHKEIFGDGFFKHANNRDELNQCAYEGFDFARNKFIQEYSSE